MNLEQQTVGELLRSLGDKTPTPGGGAVASLTAALGAALARMVVNYSVGRKKLAEHDELHREALRTLADLQASAVALADEDARAYGRLNELWRLPADDERRQREFEDAVHGAIDAPARAIEVSLGILHVLQRLAGKVNATLLSDFVIAGELAETAARAAAGNVRVNLPLLEDASEGERIERETTRLLDRAKRLREQVAGERQPTR